MSLLETPRAMEPAPPPVQASSYPCSLAQKRFWVLNQLQPGNPSLHVALRWQIEGVIATSTLENAFRRVIERHEILRYSFSETDGEPAQTPEAAVPFRIPEIELSALPPADAQAEAQRIAELEARASFDLRSAPPFFRVTRLRFRDQISVLLITAHHIIFDGWSIGLLAREVMELCLAEQQGRQAQLPELPLSYGEYALWQSESSGGREADDSSFWQKRLEGMRHFELPTDRARPSVQTTSSAIHAADLPGALVTDLLALGKRHGATLYTTALAALLTLLHRYTGETDIGIGTQVAVRDEVELEPLLGLFINTLVLRSDLSGDPAFTELLHRVGERVSEALEHRHMPLEEVINLLRPQRDLSRNVLFSINFLLQKSVDGSYDDLRLSELPPLSSGAIYDLNIYLLERAGCWQVVCEYNTDLFETQTIERLLRSYQTLLQSIATAPERNLSRLPLLAEADRHELLSCWNDTAADYPRQLTVSQLVEAQAAATPDAPAVFCAGQVLSYRELDRQASRLARELQQLGAAPGTMVGVLLERSNDLPMTLLAILKAGAAYVPIDPTHPPDRIAYVAANCRPVVTVTRSTLADRLGSAGTATLLLDRDAGRIAAHSTDPVPVTASPADTAYVIYTSGSTGRPKGAMVHHQALVNLIHAVRREPGLGPGDTLLSPSTIAFDIGALEVFLPLSVGARLVLATEREIFDGAELARLMNEQKATMMFSTPVGWQLLLAAGWQGTPGLKILCGGEALTRQLADALIPLCAELWNGYGPTETTVFACLLRIHAGAGPVHLGPPLPNYRFYILDSHGEPMPPGAPGELHIGGDGVGKGYVNLPELTQARFIADRYSSVDGARLYKSGDIVRLRAQGELEYLGRADNQIKLRGFRIELSEIESVLLAQPSVAEAVVVAGRDQAGDGAIWAYVAPRAPSAGDEALKTELRKALARSLPRYMCPASITLLRELPKLPTGKIDRRSLPKPAAEEPPAVGAVAPRSNTELRLARIWADTLGVADVASHENFFELGGHSLLAARALARIHKEFDRRVSLSAWFSAPTLGEFARLLEQDSAREYDFRQVVKLQPNGSRPPLIAINNTGIYYELSRALGADQPFTSLQLFDPSMPEGERPSSFEAIAAAYVALIRRIQPEGPYNLLGWCMAGTLSYEIARQLRTAGLGVAHLILIDTYVPNYLKRLSPLRALLADYSYRWKLVAADWARVRSGRQRLRDFLCNRVFVQKLLRLLGRPVPVNADPVAAENYDSWLLNYLQDAVSRYQPGPYDGRLTLFRSAEEPSGRLLDYRMGWGAYARGVDVVVIDGDHFSMFREPGVARMAAIVGAVLDGTWQSPRT